MVLETQLSKNISNSNDNNICSNYDKISMNKTMKILKEITIEIIIINNIIINSINDNNTNINNDNNDGNSGKMG